MVTINEDGNFDVTENHPDTINELTPAVIAVDPYWTREYSS